MLDFNRKFRAAKKKSVCTIFCFLLSSNWLRKCNDVRIKHAGTGDEGVAWADGRFTLGI